MPTYFFSGTGGTVSAPVSAYPASRKNPIVPTGDVEDRLWQAYAGNDPRQKKIDLVAKPPPAFLTWVKGKVPEARATRAGGTVSLPVPGHCSDRVNSD